MLDNLLPPGEGDASGEGDPAADVLWIDRPDALRLFAVRSAVHSLPAEHEAKILQFIEHGFTIFRGLAAPSEAEAIAREIRAFWTNPLAGALCETYELPGDGSCNVTPAPDLMLGFSKLLDYHAFSPRLRAVMADVSLNRFLRAILEDTPKLFQSLAFWKGSEAPVHRDSAYVRIPNCPSGMIGVWVALEDVREGSGEIRFYPDSHRDPDYMFGGHSKWLEAAPQEIAEFVAWHERQLAASMRERRSFVCAAGDCLVWHGDMLHSAAPVTIEGASRQSVVAHFTRASFDLPYFEHGPRHMITEDGVIHTSEFSANGFH